MQSTEDFLAQLQNEPEFLEGAPHLDQVAALTEILETNCDITNANYKEIMT